MCPKRRAIILLSGGLDSATVLYIARSEGYQLHATSFDYGQRHTIELRRALALAREVGVVEHTILRLDPALFRGSSLVGHTLDVPLDRPIDETIPSTYVPARNIIFLSHALALAESTAAKAIFIGANALDYSGYPDCRPQFYAAFREMARLGTRDGVEGAAPEIITPLIHMTKAEIIRRGVELGVDYAMTSSCYDPDSLGRPCQRCDSCVLRARGFREAGMADPLLMHRD